MLATADGDMSLKHLAGLGQGHFIYSTVESVNILLIDSI